MNKNNFQINFFINPNGFSARLIKANKDFKQKILLLKNLDKNFDAMAVVDTILDTVNGEINFWSLNKFIFYLHNSCKKEQIDSKSLSTLKF